MSIEFLNELENKVEALIETVLRVRQENAQLKQELEQKSGTISGFENENNGLKNELAALKADSNGREQKLSATAERIQGLIARLETVQ